MTPRVALVGMMGAGKTTVGRLLAERLGWPYLDTDEEVVRRCGMSVADMFATQGEAAFRAEEARVLRAAAASEGPLVISVAGGAVLDPANRRCLAGAGTVVWLRAEIATLAARLGAGEGRPLLAGGAAAALARIYPERRALYEQVADVTLDVEGRDALSLAAAAAAALSAREVAAGA